MTLARDPAAAFYWEANRRPDRHVRSAACGSRSRGRVASGLIPSYFRANTGSRSLELSKPIPSVTTPAGSSARCIKTFSATERPGSGLCLLLTGTLHKHHFSAAISLGHRSRSARWDWCSTSMSRTVAARPSNTWPRPTRCGSTAASLADAGPQAIAWDNVGADAGRLEIVAVAPSTLVLAEAGRSATRVQVFAAIQPGSFTHRLHYRWRWTSSSGLTR